MSVAITRQKHLEHFLFPLENLATRNKQTTCLLWLSKCKFSLLAVHAFASSVSPCSFSKILLGILMQILWSDWPGHCKLPAISVKWLCVVNKIATFPRFPEGWINYRHIEISNSYFNCLIETRFFNSARAVSFGYFLTELDSYRAASKDMGFQPFSLVWKSYGLCALVLYCVFF